MQQKLLLPIFEFELFILEANNFLFLKKNEVYELFLTLLKIILYVYLKIQANR